MNRKIEAIRYLEGRPIETSEALAGEEPLQIKINGNAYTITMRTPGDDRALTTGLLFTERVIRSSEDVVRISEIQEASGQNTTIVNVVIKEGALAGKNLLNRSLLSNASCGVCGKTELCDLTPSRQLPETDKKLDIQLIPTLLEIMHSRQSTFERTGGSHAAAAFNVAGELLSVKEDIGRHNAVDKVIGDLLTRNLLRRADILFISGRVSYEIVSKCAEASIPFLLAVSAPSSLAVDLCCRNGITLIGFCRGNRATVYTGDKKVMTRSAILGPLMEKAL